MTIDDTLLPCPFCGGAARCGEYSPSWDTTMQIVSCGTCEMSVDRRFRSEALAAWNRRTPDPEAAHIEAERDAAIARIEAYKTMLVQAERDVLDNKVRTTAAIVAWMRGIALSRTMRVAANRIEAGEHLKGPKL